MYRLLVLFFVPMLFMACESAPKKPGSTEKISVPKEIVASNLYSHYVTNPGSIAEKDNNVLIEYAVDNDLDCQRTPNGVYYTIDQKGSGPLLQKGGPVTAHYKGYLLNGNVFDSSYKRGKPLQFNVGQMIPGWNEWLTMVNPGTRSTLLIPSPLAYGSRGFGDLIPANSPLVFEVEILAPETE